MCAELAGGGGPADGGHGSQRERDEQDSPADRAAEQAHQGATRVSIYTLLSYYYLRSQISGLSEEGRGKGRGHRRRMKTED